MDKIEGGTLRCKCVRADIPANIWQRLECRSNVWNGLQEGRIQYKYNKSRPDKKHRVGLHTVPIIDVSSNTKYVTSVRLPSSTASLKVDSISTFAGFSVGLREASGVDFSGVVIWLAVWEDMVAAGTREGRN